MAKISLRKATIFLMELIILTIIKTKADVFAPSSPRPTLLPIRLLQPSQTENNRKRHCYKNTAEKCNHLRMPTSMKSCVIYKYMICMARGHFPTIPTVEHANKCAKDCFKHQEVASPQPPILHIVC